MFGAQVQAQIEKEYKLDCFSVVVGKDASADGSVLFAHNEDTGIRLVNTYKVPAAKHNSREQIILDNGGTLPQVSETFGYLWINLPGIKVCDTYLNEKGLAIGSDGCPSRETEPEITDGGIVFWLRRIVAERASSAREGVILAGKLIDQFGYGASGRTYIFADADEAWAMAVVNGKHWVARRVPDDQVMVIPNYYTIDEVDLSDTVNFYGSPDIIDYAIQKGWYSPSTDGSFNFAKAYSKPGSLRHKSNIRRKWRGLNLVSNENFQLNDEFPFSVKPAKKVSVHDLMTILRDHYEGTDLDHSKMYTLGNPYDLNGSMIGSRSTQYGAIAQLRKDLPPAIASLLWIAHYRPDLQAFSPWYSSMISTPEVYRENDHSWALKNQLAPPESIFNRENEHSYWTFIKLVDKVDKDYLKNSKVIKKVWSTIEDDCLKSQQKFEAKVKKQWLRNPEKAINTISNYSEKVAFTNYLIAIDMIKNYL